MKLLRFRLTDVVCRPGRSHGVNDVESRRSRRARMRSVNEPCLVLEPSIADSHHLDKTTRCPIRSNGSEVISGVSCALTTPTTPVTIIWLINSYTKIHFGSSSAATVSVWIRRLTSGRL